MAVRKETRSQEIWRLSLEVTVDSVSPNLIYYSVAEYIVSFDKRSITRPWNCTCPHGSLYRGTKDEQCKHIQAVKKRISEEGNMTW